jgi:hypothetical protein
VIDKFLYFILATGFNGDGDSSKKGFLASSFLSGDDIGGEAAYPYLSSE